MLSSTWKRSSDEPQVAPLTRIADSTGRLTDMPRIRVATAINADLLTQDTRHALVAHRGHRPTDAKQAVTTGAVRWTTPAPGAWPGRVDRANSYWTSLMLRTRPARRAIRTTIRNIPALATFAVQCT
jgi:hypothetical protein